MSASIVISVVIRGVGNRGGGGGGDLKESMDWNERMTR